MPSCAAEDQEGRGSATGALLPGSLHDNHIWLWQVSAPLVIPLGCRYLLHTAVMRIGHDDIYKKPLPRARPGIPQGTLLMPMTYHLSFTNHGDLSKNLVLNVNPWDTFESFTILICLDRKKGSQTQSRVTQTKDAMPPSLLSQKVIKTQDFMFLCLGKNTANCSWMESFHTKFQAASGCGKDPERSHLEWVFDHCV